MTYTIVTLIGLLILGILAHILSDLAKEKQRDASFPINTYFGSTWPAIALSFVIGLTIIIIRHEMLQIPDFTNWEGACIALVGFCGRSVLIPALNWIKTKFGVTIDDDTKK